MNFYFDRSARKKLITGGILFMESKIKKDLLPVCDNPIAEAYVTAVKHRASWLGLIYDEARKDGNEELIEKYLWNATYRCGVASGERLKKILDMNDIDCSKFAKAFGAGTYKAEALAAEIPVCEKERIDLEYYGCALLASWKEWGLEDEVCQKLCRITMNHDTGVADTLGLKFDLKETLADGCECCKCSYHK